MLEQRIQSLSDQGYGVVLRRMSDYWQMSIQDRPRGVEICRGSGVTISDAVKDAEIKLKAR